MPGIVWSDEEKKCEWAFAKEKLMPSGKLLPNGSKLRRKDYPDELKHGNNVEDIVQMLLLFFTPQNDRNYRHENWIFGDWVGEYAFLYRPPTYDPEEEDNSRKLKKNHPYLYKR